MRALYKYPQAEFPYQQLIDVNARAGSQRSREREYELGDTGVFAESRYFDITAEYAKVDVDDILIRLTLANRGPDAATLHVLPTVWFRNSWVWGCTHEGCTLKPRISRLDDQLLTMQHETLGVFRFAAESPASWLFTENETNNEKLFGAPSLSPYVKDAFHEAVVHGNLAAVNPRQFGTKAAPHYVLDIPAGGEVVLRFRLTVAHDWPEHRFARLRRGSHGAPGGSRCLLRNQVCANFGDRAAQRHAPGLCGSTLVQAVLPLRDQRLARG